MNQKLSRTHRRMSVALIWCAALVGLLVWLTASQSTDSFASTEGSQHNSQPAGYAVPTPSAFKNQDNQGTEGSDSPTVNFRELTNFKFVLDPGHGGTEHHAVGPRGSLEKNWNLSISENLYPKLSGHGAVVYRTRTCDCTVSLDDRVRFNNNLYQSGGTINNWRLISIHLNGASDPATNYTSTWYRYQTPNAPSQELARAFATQIGRTTNLTSYAWTEDLEMTRCTEPIGYNILTESGFLTNAAFENRLLDQGFASSLADAHYRSAVDYWLVGYTGPHQNLKQDIYNSYWDNLNNGIDPGVPFDNGGGYYAHQWNDAFTQEFKCFCQ